MRISPETSVLRRVLPALTALWLAGAPMFSFALTGAEELLRRKQDFESERRDRAIDDIYLPGDAVSPALPPSVAPGGPCFTVNRLRLENADALFDAAQQQRWQQKVAGRCMDMAGIRALQAALTQELVDRGYVTSRVLLPEQDVSGGELRLTLVPGRIEGYDGKLPARTFAMAFPGRAAGDATAPGPEDVHASLLHLPSLEQGIENINRLPGMNARLDIVPGSTHGISRIQVDGVDGRHWQVQATLDADSLENRADTRGRGTLVLGNLLGMADRITLGGGQALDDHRLDMSRDASVEIDVPYGFWRFTLGHSRQGYRDDVAGALLTFRTEGESSNTRLEVSRVLHRRGNTRWALAALAGEDVSENRIEGTIIEVSSQTVRTLGLRLEHSTVQEGVAWTIWLTVDHGDASGPATHPLGLPPVADTEALRSQLYLRAARPWADRRTVWTTTLNAQYSPDEPYSAQRMSLTSSGMVRGFPETGVSATNVLALRSEWSHAWETTRLPGLWQPYLGFDAGWTGNDATVAAAARAFSMTAGLLWSAKGWQARIEASDPFGGASSIGPVEPTLSATLVWAY